MNKTTDALPGKMFADGVDRDGMIEKYTTPNIKGFTTNPTLESKAGVCNYETFAQEIPTAIPDCAISFEVFSDEFSEMERQGVEIAGWDENVYVKILITTPPPEPSYHQVRRLWRAGVKGNVMEIITLQQVRQVVASLSSDVPSYVSVSAGRIAETGGRSGAAATQSSLSSSIPVPS